jgi:hypothetical protein
VTRQGSERGERDGEVHSGSETRDGEWIVDGPNILSSELRRLLEQAFQDSSLIVEHRFYYGSRAHKVSVFDDMEDLDEYLRANARPGDSIWCWRYNDLCRDDNCVTHGKYPDEVGRTPRGGAY